MSKKLIAIIGATVTLAGIAGAVLLLGKREKDLIEEPKE